MTDDGLPSVEEVLQHLALDYKMKGDQYVIRCINPSHADRHPSLEVNQQGVFHCWSCGFSGNLHTMVKTLTGRSIYQEFNIKNTKDSAYKNAFVKTYSGELPKQKDWQSIFLSIEGTIKKNFYEEKKVLDYIRSIGIYKDSFLEERGIGYVTNVPIFFKEAQSDKRSMFLNRILFPVYRTRVDGTKVMINIEARDMTGEQKPKVLYPRKTTTDYLYNWEFIDPSEPLIVVEGIKDLCKVWNVDKNVVSTFGTNYGINQIELLKSASEVIFFIDNDAAGKKVLDKFDSVSDKEFSVALPPREGADPNDLSLMEIEKCLNERMIFAKYIPEESKQFESVSKQITASTY
jgi:DNA primase